MSKKRQVIDKGQGELLLYLQPDTPPAPGSVNISLRIRHAISSAIKKSGKDRIDICADIYRLSGIEVSKATLDKWSAESTDIASDHVDNNGNKRWGIPGEIIPAFCISTNNYEVLYIVTEAGNHKALKGKDVVRARMGLLKEEIAKKQQEYKELEKAMVEGK